VVEEEDTVVEDMAVIGTTVIDTTVIDTTVIDTTVIDTTVIGTTAIDTGTVGDLGVMVEVGAATDTTRACTILHHTIVTTMDEKTGASFKRKRFFDRDFSNNFNSNFVENKSNF
jgi:hypothetical protein